MKVQIRKITMSKMGLLYIISMIIIEIHQANIFSGYYLTPFFIGLFWFAVAIVKKGGKFGGNNIDKITLLMLIPWGIFLINNIFLFLFDKGWSEFYKSSFVQIFFTPCILLGAWGAFTLFKTNTLKYLVYATIIQYIVVLGVQLYRMGISNFFSGITTVFTGNSVNNPFETNSDVIFSLGILLLFLMDSNMRNSKKAYGNIFLISLSFFLGGKRIGFAAILLLATYMMLSKHIYEKKIKYIQYIASSIIIIILFLFVYSIDSGILSTFVWKNNINLMGRMNMWDYISKFFDMKISFLGHGYSFCNLLLERDRIYTFEGHVYALHSDILKVFVEMGFWVFTFWLVYNLIILPVVTRKKYGIRFSNLFWIETVYLFILYLTDNTINYYITQTVYVLVLTQMIYIIDDQVKNKIDW